jgi:hypothetical protein
MLILKSAELTNYYQFKRKWQGIPSIERTAKGRLFSAFYSGGKTEQAGNYVVLLKSDNDGESWSEPIAIAFEGEEKRAYDECLWIDPDGRLWFIWSVMPDHGVWAAICDSPEDDDNPLRFGEPFCIGEDVMMNKPTVLSDGGWLFPCAVWGEGVFVVPEFKTKHEPRLAYVYRTADRGITFERLGGTDIRQRSFDEHMILELKDGRLAMYVRTYYGIGVSYSSDGGITWSEGGDSGLQGPCSRFFIRRLKSGAILLVNHKNFIGRNNLTAMLSHDEGVTWQDELLIDERTGVSYPDGTETEDGYIYLTYDRDRYGASEILMAVFNEADIKAGDFVSEKGRSKQTISRLRY